jgi:hypothetical protein
MPTAALLVFERDLVDAEVLGNPMHVQKDEQHDGYEADERKHKQHDHSGSICIWQPMIAPPSLGLREHREASCHSTPDPIREVRSLATAFRRQIELLDAEPVADKVDKTVGGAGVEPDRGSLSERSATAGGRRVSRPPGNPGAEQRFL